MTKPDTLDTPVTDQNLYQAFALMKRKEFDAAHNQLNKGLQAARDKKDVKLEGIYYSTLGILAKLKGDFKLAYKHYQQAEKLIPEDHSLKIISAVLLVEEFKQYDTAARKLEKVISTATDPAVLHHARGVLALTCFLMGKKEQAQKLFEELLSVDFAPLRFAANLDYKAVETFVAKGFLPEECKNYLGKALALAKKNKEKVYQAVIEKLIELLS